MNGSHGGGRFGRHDGRRGRRMSAQTAERLLDGLGAEGDDPRAAQLARLLAAAARPLPGRPEDERAALEAFRAAVAGRPVSGSAPVPGPAPLTLEAGRRAARRRHSVKVLVSGAVAAFALSGVAIAAQNGGLLHPFHGHHAGPFVTSTSTSGAAGTSRTGPGRSGGPAGPAGPGVAGTPSGAPGQHSGAGSTSPDGNDASDPSGAKGLCQAYESAAGKGKTVDASKQERLAREAGGADRVAAYCARLTGSDSSGDHGDQPPVSTTPSAPVVPSPSPDAGGKSSPSPSPEGDSKPSTVPTSDDLGTPPPTRTASRK